jgi:hypothetical protein
MLRLLHVANGHCTVRLIEAAGLPGRVSIWADPLHDGPIPRKASPRAPEQGLFGSASRGQPGCAPPPAGQDVSTAANDSPESDARRAFETSWESADEEWIRVRAQFLTPAGGNVAETEAGLRQWRAVIDDHGAYDELVLWFEHDLFDQLILLQILSRVGRERPVAKPISLVSIDAYPGHPDFKGLGELEPADIAALFEQRVPVTRAQLALAAAAWDVFREQDAEQLRAFVRRDTSALPFLAPALERYLEERPAPEDGLTRSERRLLAQLETGPLDIHAAWRGMHDGERAYYITDTSFLELITRLASRSPALIDVRFRGGDGPLPQGTLALRP